VGVPIFFTLSGFVIAFSADGREAGAFARSRILRLFPAAWICASLTLAVRWGDNGVAEQYLRSLILWPAGPWIDGVYWTLGVEMIFYGLIFGALLAKVRLCRVVTVIAVWGSLFWIAHFANHLAGGPFSDQFALLDGWDLNLLTLLPHGCFFAVGMLFWSLTRRDAPLLHKLLLIPTVGSGLLYCFASGQNALAEEGGAARWEIFYPAMMWLFAIAVMAVTIRWNSYFANRLAHWRKPIRVLGLATYPLYLVHENVGRWVALALLPFFQPVAAMLLAYVSMIALAIILLIPESYVRKALRYGINRLPVS
jgi:exopolysaccharide production protein ExoZ